MSGRGLAQKEGGLVEEILPGDIVSFGLSEKHWHSAGHMTSMTHIAIAERLDGIVVDWLEHVTDEQYQS